MCCNIAEYCRRCCVHTIRWLASFEPGNPQEGPPAPRHRRSEQAGCSAIKARCGHTLPEILGLQEALPVPTPRHLQPARHLSANDRHFAMRTPSKVSVRCHHRLGTLWRRLGKMLSAGDVWVQTCLGLGRSFRELDGLTIRGWLGFQVTVAWLLVSFWRNLMTTFLSPLCC